MLLVDVGQVDSPGEDGVDVESGDVGGDVLKRVENQTHGLHGDICRQMHCLP